MKIVFLFRNLRRGHLDAGLLSAYLDAQVTPDERRRVEAHLAECAACQRELAGLRQTVALLQALPRVPTPRAFTLAEVQVGRGRPVGQTARIGGMLRGLAAVSAAALVVVLAATLLRREAWSPSLELARVAAPAIVATDVQPQSAAPAPPRAAAVIAPTKAPAVAEKPTLAPMLRSAAPTAPAPQAAPTTVRTPPAAPARPVEPAPALAAAPPTHPAAAAPPPAAAAPAAARAPDAVMPGGAAAAGTASVAGPTADAKNAIRPSESETAADAFKAASALDALPADAALAVATGGDLWAIERGAARRLAQAEGLQAPTVSPDRAWIAYRRPGKDGAEIWAVPWEGGEPRRLLAEHALPAEGPTDTRPARIADVRWLADSRTLAVTAFASGAAWRMELWAVEVASAARRLVTSGDLPYPPIASPDGAAFAFLRRAADDPAAADVWLVAADGAEERPLLRIPLPADDQGGRTQIHWLSDGRGFWLAIPDAGPTGLLLYRVMLGGAAASPIRLDARQAFWSADGSRLAYTGSADGAAGARELFVAAADGTAARRYATLLNGRFVAWSPDSVHFLYEDGGHLFVGAAQEAASRLASDVQEPRWAGADQVVYVTARDGLRQLIYHALAGRPIVLQTLPADRSLDGLWP